MKTKTPNMYIQIPAWVEHNLYDAIPVPISIVDRNFNLVHANAKFKELFGEYQNRKCYHIYKVRQTMCFDCKAKDIFQDGKSRVIREICYNIAGEPFYNLEHIFPIFAGPGQVNFFVIMSIDVTEWELVRTQHEMLFEQVPCSIFIIDRNFRIVRSNRIARTMFGLIDGRHCYQSLKGHENPCEDCTAQKTFIDGQMHTGQSIVKRPDGEEVFLQVTTVPLEDPKGKQDHILEMAVDVTLIKKLEAEKLEAERLAAVGQTVAGLAHGVKNLITALEGGIYLLSTGLKHGDAERLQTGMDMLFRNTERISTFIKAFLSYSKGRTIQAKKCSPVSIAREVVELYRKKAKENGIELIFESPEPVKEAAIDYESMHECLTNLTGNALDACMSSNQTGRHTRVKVYEQNEVIFFEVIDDGCGMDYEVKQKVFTTFFTTKGLGGTGIGLLMTRKIIKEHGGSIEFESEPTQGSTFRIKLPRNRLPKLVETESQKE